MYREFLAVVMRLAVVVNPDAGLGGKLGFKGSDGRAAEARAAGAQDRAGPRMRICLEKLAELAREANRNSSMGWKNGRRLDSRRVYLNRKDS